MSSSSDTALVLCLFAAPAVALLWAALRTHYRISRGSTSAQLTKPNRAEIAAAAASLAAAFGFLY